MDCRTTLGPLWSLLMVFWGISLEVRTKTDFDRVTRGENEFNAWRSMETERGGVAAAATCCTNETLFLLARLREERTQPLFDGLKRLVNPRVILSAAALIDGRCITKLCTGSGEI